MNESTKYQPETPLHEALTEVSVELEKAIASFQPAKAA